MRAPLPRINVVADGLVRDAAGQHEAITLGGPLTVEALAAVARRGVPVGISAEAEARISASAALLDRLVESGSRIYGVTTGYGPLACQQITPAQSERLQRNLLNHLATGVGAPYDPETTRAIMLARLSALAQGYSAARPETLALLAECLNRGVTPIVPSKGTVGASGDLTPLAHLALALTGRGEALFEGLRLPAAAALARAGLAPLVLGRKEGLALVNGTSAMTGVAALSAVDIARLLDLSLFVGLLYAEVSGAHRDAWHPRFGRARPHPGQCAVHAALHAMSADAPRLVEEGALPPVIEADALDEDGVAHRRAMPQDPYTLRCLPQLIGAAVDVARFHRDVVERELRSATDNPLIFIAGPDGDPDGEAIGHGGNFYGQHIAFASDALAPVIVKLAVLLERIIARVTDPLLNGGLPPFLQERATGLNSGFMGAQVTASALVAEMRAAAHPASMQSIPTNANNQDVVTMGTIAARKVAALIEDAFGVMAIAALVLAQAHDLRSTSGPPFSAASRWFVGCIRRVSPFLEEDRPLSDEIAAVAELLRRDPLAGAPVVPNLVAHIS